MEKTMCPFMKCNCPYCSQGQCPYGYNPYQQDNIPNPDFQRSSEEDFGELDEPYDAEGVFMPSPYTIEVQNPNPMMYDKQHPDMHDEKYPDMHGNINIPKGPPPMHEPMKKHTGPSTKAVDQGAIKGCKYRYVYIWPRRGRGFWAYLTYVGRTSVAGFRWNGRRWTYFGMDLRQIESFQCY